MLISVCMWNGYNYYKNNIIPEVFEFTPEDYEDPKSDKNAEKNLSESDRVAETQKREDALRLFLEFPYFRLPKITVPIVRNGYVYGYFRLNIAMKATGRKTFIKSKILLPRLVDGIYSDLYTVFENLWNGQVDPKTSVIKERIFFVIEKILGKNHIETVFLREIVLIRTDKEQAD